MVGTVVDEASERGHIHRTGLALGGELTEHAQRLATRFGLEGRGVVEAGAFADLVIFDDADIVDLATFEDPRVPPAGIPYVVVNGQLAVERGAVTAVLAGRPVPEA